MLAHTTTHTQTLKKCCSLAWSALMGGGSETSSPKSHLRYNSVALAMISIVSTLIGRPNACAHEANTWLWCCHKMKNSFFLNEWILRRWTFSHLGGGWREGRQIPAQRFPWRPWHGWNWRERCQGEGGTGVWIQRPPERPEPYVSLRERLRTHSILWIVYETTKKIQKKKNQSGCSVNDCSFREHNWKQAWRQQSEWHLGGRGCLGCGRGSPAGQQ